MKSVYGFSGSKLETFPSFKVAKAALDGWNRALNRFVAVRKASRLATKQIRIYADGSCFATNLGVCPPIAATAGWGFLAVTFPMEKILVEQQEIVSLCTTDSDYYGASTRDGNTAELTAIVKALLWIKSTQAISKDVLYVICSDSDYAIDHVQGRVEPQPWRFIDNGLLVQRCVRIFSGLLHSGYLILFQKVKTHSSGGDLDSKFHNRADKLAKQGRKMNLANP